MEQIVTTSTTKGIVIALILIIIALAFFFLGVKTTSPLQSISFLILIAGIIWAVILYGNQIDHNSTFGNYFAHGFKVAALVTVIMIIYIVVFIYVFPQIKENGLDAVKNSMKANDKIPKEQIDKTMVFMNKFFIVLAVARTMLFYMIIGAIASLIGAGITKKNPRPIEIDR